MLCIGFLTLSPRNALHSFFICLQNFFRSYKKLAGMTGTAATEASEFDNIYKLPVTVVPTNQKVRRTDESDVVFSQEEGMLYMP